MSKHADTSKASCSSDSVKNTSQQQTTSTEKGELKFGQYKEGSSDFWTTRILPVPKSTADAVRTSVQTFDELLRRREAENETGQRR